MIGNNIGNKKIAIDATRVIICFLLIADINNVIPVTLKVHTNAKSI